MKKLILSFLLLIILTSLFLGYLGAFPYLSQYLVKPVDLGIKADTSLVTSFESKYGARNGTGRVNLDVNLSSQEVTSIFSVWETRDRFFPLSNVQVRFNPDGSGEASGYLKVATAITLARSLGYSDTEIEIGKRYVQHMAGDLPFYVKGRGAMTNNTLTISPETFKIGRVTVPEFVTNPASVAVGDMIKRRLQQIGGADIKIASFQSGSLKLVGTVPETIKY